MNFTQFGGFRLKLPFQIRLQLLIQSFCSGILFIVERHDLVVDVDIPKQILFLILQINESLSDFVEIDSLRTQIHLASVVQPDWLQVSDIRGPLLVPLVEPVLLYHLMEDKVLKLEVDRP